MKGKVLLADDDELFLAMMRQAVVGEGYAARTCATAFEARAALAEQSYDVVIADIHMPGNGSLELLHSEEIKARRPGVILVTGNASLDTALGALEAQRRLIYASRSPQLNSSVRSSARRLAFANASSWTRFESKISRFRTDRRQ